MKHADTKDIQDIINQPTFGNLAKTATSVILAVGIAVSTVIVVARGGDIAAIKDGLEVFAPFLISAVAGGAVNTFGDSETAKFIKKNGLPTEEVKVVSPISLVSQPVDSGDIRGNFADNAETAPALLSRD